MKIISNKRYDAMLDLIAAQQKTIKIYQKQVEQYVNTIRILSQDINSHADIIFPNTDERGLNSVDTASMYPKTKNDFLEL